MLDKTPNLEKPSHPQHNSMALGKCCWPRHMYNQAHVPLEARPITTHFLGSTFSGTANLGRLSIDIFLTFQLQQG